MTVASLAGAGAGSGAERKLKMNRGGAILRPGPLTDDSGTGGVRLSPQPLRGAVTRDDVAALLAELLARERSSRGGPRRRGRNANRRRTRRPPIESAWVDSTQSC